MIDVAKNWNVGGNSFGYYCKCKWCGCKLNDLIYWGPRNQITGENRYHGDEIDPRDSIENYPQDKKCCVCGEEGCYPLICIEWQTYKRDGLGARRPGSRPPVAKTPESTEGSGSRGGTSVAGNSAKEASQGSAKSIQFLQYLEIGVFQGQTTKTTLLLGKLRFGEFT